MSGADGKSGEPKPEDAAVARVSTRDLFPKGHSEIRIDHQGLEYRLRITRQNKLILYR